MTFNELNIEEKKNVVNHLLQDLGKRNSNGKRLDLCNYNSLWKIRKSHCYEYGSDCFVEIDDYNNPTIPVLREKYYLADAMCLKYIPSQELENQRVIDMSSIWRDVLRTCGVDIRVEELSVNI